MQQHSSPDQSSLQRLESLMVALKDAEELRGCPAERLFAIAEVVRILQETSLESIRYALSTQVDTLEKVWSALQPTAHAILGPTIGYLSHGARKEITTQLDKFRKLLAILERSPETAAQREEIYDQLMGKGFQSSYSREQYIEDMDCVYLDKQTVLWLMGKLEHEELQIDLVFEKYVTHSRSL